MDLNTGAAIASILGFFVGGAGLIFSIKAWIRAGAAERAAEEATQAVRRGNAAEDLQSLSVEAKEMLSCVENHQFQAASLRGRDLVSGIYRAKRRWSEYFTLPDSVGRLEKIGKDVERVSVALSARDEDILPDERERLLSFCHKILRILNEEAGNMLRSLERT